MQLPIVDREQQKRQTVSEQELNAIIAGVERKYAVMFALMAGTGLRIGEALGVRGIDFSEDRFATQLREDELYRGEWCSRVGLGFSVCTLSQIKVMEMKVARSA